MNFWVGLKKLSQPEFYGDDLNIFSFHKWVGALYVLFGMDRHVSTSGCPSLPLFGSVCRISHGPASLVLSS